MIPVNVDKGDLMNRLEIYAIVTGVLILSFIGIRSLDKEQKEAYNSAEAVRWRDLRFAEKKMAFDACAARKQYPVESSWDGSVTCK